MQLTKQLMSFNKTMHAEPHESVLKPVDLRSAELRSVGLIKICWLKICWLKMLVNQELA